MGENFVRNAIKKGHESGIKKNIEVAAVPAKIQPLLELATQSAKPSNEGHRICLGSNACVSIKYKQSPTFHTSQNLGGHTCHQNLWICKSFRPRARPRPPPMWTTTTKIEINQHYFFRAEHHYDIFSLDVAMHYIQSVNVAHGTDKLIGQICGCRHGSIPTIGFCRNTLDGYTFNELHDQDRTTSAHKRQLPLRC